MEIFIHASTKVMQHAHTKKIRSYHDWC